MKSTYLDTLALKHGTDKYNGHWYTQHYGTHFRRWKNKKINLLEIGVGGGVNPCKGGESLRMWKEYFGKGMIYSIDIYKKTGIEEERIRIFTGSQADQDFLRRVWAEIGTIDIIIDDGSHVNSHVITSFKTLFPLLKAGGVYVVEDTQTSYWPYEGLGGDSDNVNNPATAMNFFKGLTDCLNYQEFIKPGYEPSYYDRNIVSVHFYHNMVFVYKGDNEEPSNIIRNNSFDHLLHYFVPKRDN